MLAVGDVVRQRNVRAVLLEASSDVLRAVVRQSSECVQAVRLLKAHGFRVGLLHDYDVDATWRELEQELHACERFDSGSPRGKSRRCLASRLNTPLSRSLLVSMTLSAGHCEADTAEEIATTGANALKMTDFAHALLRIRKPLSSSQRLFGPHVIDQAQVFYQTQLSFALVNLKPIVQGHTLIVPNRVVDRFDRLDADEVADLWQTAQHVGKALEQHYHAHALTFAIQDGAAAGQTVPHVHIHVLPRHEGDFEPKDRVYDEIERHEAQLRMDHEERAPRSLQEMAREASSLRALFQ